MLTNKYFELMPLPEQHQKRFYGKAYIEQWFKDSELLSETLYSYGEPIIRKYPNGKLERLWGGWSQTTQKHIFAFCRIRKQEYLKLYMPYRHSDMNPQQSYQAMMARRLNK